ncbi:MAG TPA: hypothetical protein VHS13_05445 [Edaphobacter sp.]|jgi:flagellar biosynthesis protein FliR|nr:hypothetical protein [Edaphobacter sp.]
MSIYTFFRAYVAALEVPAKALALSMGLSAMSVSHFSYRTQSAYCV